MIVSALVSSASRIAGPLLILLLMAAPVQAAPGARARLVQCGEDTCLRIAGHRQSRAVAIRIGGEDLAVEGDRAWRMTVPLATARAWPTSLNGRTLTLTSVDTRTGAENRNKVELPPGALGRRVELAVLEVRAR